MDRLDLSLEKLDGKNEGEPESAPTPMVARCLRLRRVPIGELTQGDVRLLLGQKIGAKYLLPIAMGWLREDPLLEVEFYPGDLLLHVARLGKQAWAEFPNEQAECASFLLSCLAKCDKRDPFDRAWFLLEVAKLNPDAWSRFPQVHVTVADRLRSWVSSTARAEVNKNQWLELKHYADRLSERFPPSNPGIGT
ncbi:MAG TPA: contact-dependent growth inhibition system immunity protein [Phycisphaerales bacterium]|nr:contact-dependent growth inhibition system immunity protein [Phycisphaerales bacterium]